MSVSHSFRSSLFTASHCSYLLIVQFYFIAQMVFSAWFWEQGQTISVVLLSPQSQAGSMSSGSPGQGHLSDPTPPSVLGLTSAHIPVLPPGVEVLCSPLPTVTLDFSSALKTTV